MKWQANRPVVNYLNDRSESGWQRVTDLPDCRKATEVAFQTEKPLQSELIPCHLLVADVNLSQQVFQLGAKESSLLAPAPVADPAKILRLHPRRPVD